MVRLFNNASLTASKVHSLARTKVIGRICPTANDYVAVLEGKEGYVLVPNWVANLVQGEPDPDEHVQPVAKAEERGNNVIWTSNKIAIEIITCNPDYAGENAFLEGVKGLDLTWEFKRDDE